MLGEEAGQRAAFLHTELLTWNLRHHRVLREGKVSCHKPCVPREPPPALLPPSPPFLLAFSGIPMLVALPGAERPQPQLVGGRKKALNLHKPLPISHVSQEPPEISGTLIQRTSRERLSSTTHAALQKGFCFKRKQGSPRAQAESMNA